MDVRGSFSGLKIKLKGRKVLLDATAGKWIDEVCQSMQQVMGYDGTSSFLCNASVVG